jgi:hypothetical protein
MNHYNVCVHSGTFIFSNIVTSVRYKHARLKDPDNDSTSPTVTGNGKSMNEGAVP